MKGGPGEDSRTELVEEIRVLKERLAETEEPLRAITHGEVDALIVSTANGDKVFTLEGADKPYRLLIEQMNEGALTFDGGGHILYSNRRVAEILKISLERIIGQRFEEFVLPLDRPPLVALIKKSRFELVTGNISLTADDGVLVPVRIALSKLQPLEVDTYGIIISDMTENREAEESLRRMNDELELKVAERTYSLERTNELLKAEISDRVIVQRQTLEEKKRLAELLSNIGDALIITDELGKIGLINRLGEKITGWKSSEARGRELGEVFAIEPGTGDYDRLLGRIKEVDGIPVRKSAIIRTKSGGLILVEFSASSLNEGESGTIGLLLVFREVDGGSA
jgi:PAS domain S-box-containing protein